MHRLSLTLFIATIAGCGGAVVREPHVYRQELLFLSAVTSKLADQQLAAAADAARAGDDVGCATLAKDALLAHARVPYHVAMALSLVDLEEDPGDPPAVPSPAAWCSAQVLSGGAQ